ncbi:MAG TPA: PAS domain S-box protein [Steroidobacteraceae bacterium]|nr:PAS domain S-box protein [Steroidobacteraceae bacterium]
MTTPDTTTPTVLEPPDLPGDEADRIGNLERARLAAVVDSSHDAIVSKTLEGRIQTWNAAAERLFGYSAEEVIGKPITIIVPQELQAEEAQILARLRAGERIDHFETVRTTKAGRRIPVSLTVSPVRNADGRIIGASKIARDISDRQRAERMLRQTQAQLAEHAAGLERLNECTARLWSCHTMQAGLDVILSAVLELLGARKGNIQLLDETATTLKIVAQRGFDGGFLDFFAEVAANDDAACARALQSGERTIVEDTETDEQYQSLREVARAAGYRAVVSTPLIGPDGTPFGMLSTHFETRHQPTQQQLRLLDMFVRHACDFIRRCKTEQTLRLREESLRDGDRRKDEFLALLAHELRNPLAPVRYALATIRKPGLTLEQRTRANEIIERQVVHMSHLLDDLLDVSRITRGAIVLKKTRTELAPVIEAAVDAARPVIDARQHSLLLDLAGEPVYLEADPVRLTQVFSNLLINAAKYTGSKGQIQVRVTKEGTDVVVSIRDNGIGISKELMPRLFTLFTQARPALERSEGGLGVGLALVRGLVTLHGGHVQARSDGPNQGSEFIVQLPMSNSAGEDGTGEAAGGSRNAQHGLKVIVVDDNQDVAESCKTLLELSGHRVSTAYTGREAVELAENIRPDVMLLDIGLPDMSGYEVARRIRATNWGSRTDLIAVTGWGQEADRERAFRAGFDHHLTKPISTDSLETLLQSLHLHPA